VAFGEDTDPVWGVLRQMQTLLDRLIHQLIELVTELVFQRVPACTAVDEERLQGKFDLVAQQEVTGPRRGWMAFRQFVECGVELHREAEILGWQVRDWVGHSFASVTHGSRQPSACKYAHLQLRRQLSKVRSRGQGSVILRLRFLGGPTVQGAPQREYCQDYGAEHQGDDGENVFAFHLPRPLAAPSRSAPHIHNRQLVPRRNRRPVPADRMVKKKYSANSQ
jgi:hypothetical protein